MIFYESDHLNTEGYIFHNDAENLNFGNHVHKNFEFIYLYDGEMQIEIANKFFDLRRGEACLIMPNQSHSFTTLRYSKSYLCVFSTSFLPDFYEINKYKKAINPIFKLKDAEKLIVKLKSKSNNYCLKGLFYQILGDFTNNTDFIENDTKLYNFVDNVLIFIEQNFSKDISLKTIANYLGYDYNYFSTLFNNTFNTTFLELLNQFKIAYAQTLLLNKNLSITSISTMCGYNTLRTFNRNFLKQTSMTPTQFKKTK